MTKNKDNENTEEFNENVEAENSDIKDKDFSMDERIEQLEEENKKLKDDFLRTFAEAENTKKRCLQEIEKNNKYAIASFAKELLGVADNLQRAIDASAKENKCDVSENMLKGIVLTQNELMKVFDKFNIHKMDIVGTVFDPNFHQVIQEVEDKKKPAGTIVAEIQTGYMINDRILREAMVVVTKA